MGRRARVAACAALLMAVAAPGAQAFDPAVEAKNYSKTLERQATYTSPAGELLLRQASRANGRAALQAQAADPEREFATDLCWNGFDGCAGEFRLYDWKAKDYGV